MTQEEEDFQFRFDPAVLANFVGACGDQYKEYPQNIISKGLFADLLFDFVDSNSEEKFKETLGKVGITTVRPHSLRVYSHTRSTLSNL